MGLLSLAARAPLRFAVGYGGAKTVAADAMVQYYLEGKEQLDHRRLAVFAAFGFFQVGFVQYQLYVSAFGKAFPQAATFAAKPVFQKLRDLRGLRSLASQVTLDQFLYHPFLYFPVFYVCKELIETGPSVETPSRALSKYVPNALEDLKALWTIFVPVSIMQFSICPMHLRVPFTATAGFFWCGVLSFMRGAAK